MLYAKTQSLTLAAIAAAIGARIYDADAAVEALEIHSLAPVESAQAGQLSFVANPAYLRFVAITGASAVILKEPQPGAKVPQLVVKNPYLAFAKAAQLFAAPRHEAGTISPDARVSPSAVLAADVTIYPFCVVEEGVILDAGVTLYPGVFVGAGSKIGEGSTIMPNTVIMPGCEIGKRALLHAGCVIGADGFGFAAGDGQIYKIPQVGTVIIGDDVELGASCTVDRAALGATVIGDGCKFDSKVHIGHNAVIGAHCLFAAHTAVAGSAKVGRGVMAGGHSGIAGHLEVGDGVQIGAMTGVIKDAVAGETYIGFPAIPGREWRRQQVHFKRLADYEKRIAALEKRLNGKLAQSHFL